MLIIRPRDLSDPSREPLLGGKARALFALQAIRLPIPEAFALSPEAFERSLTPAQRASLAAGRFSFVTPSAEVREALKEALSSLCPNGERVAVRSSALDEDGAEHSFAGQLDSFLFVAPEEVPEKVAAVWASGFSERILAYRKEHGLSPLPKPPAVLVQRMVRAEVAGVAFGADPVSGRRGTAIVAALYGLGDSLVSGESDADTFEVDREGRITRRQIAEKRWARHYADGALVSKEVLAEKISRPALTDEQIRAVAALVRRTGRHFGRPQDIEWAIEDGDLFLLQSRPITSLAGMPDPDGVSTLWDNSNITESYGGVTTPLTFSFALRIYEEVYRELCRILGIPADKIEGNDHAFKHMLGLVRGRVYYNLLSWYRTLALLPGFTLNSRFMEQMMGVKEGVPDDVLNRLKNATWGDRLQDLLGLLSTLVGMIKQCAGLPKSIERFYERLDSALAPIELEALRPDELVAYFHRLEAQLLTKWDAPLVNDLFAMIFFGALRKLVEQWCREDGLQNDLLSGEGGIVSAEPAKRIREMASLAAIDPGFVDLLCTGTLEEIRERMEGFGEFRAYYRQYLDKFSDRCLEELKLESPTLSDNPILLLRAIGRISQRPPQVEDFEQGDRRKAAEKKAKKILFFHPLRSLLFHWVLRNARDRVRDRENLRFERTRLFGRVRRIFLEIGKRLFADNLLEEPRDIFFLEQAEIFGFVEGTSTCTDLKGLVALRKAEFSRYKEGETPDERFSTRGVVYQGNSFQQPHETVVVEGDTQKGIGCFPGIIRGKVRVIRDPREAELESGSILVAERTDPGWIMLFPAAKGLLVERGSLLSHSAIVAREMGIPAIVSIPGLMDWLSDGDFVEFDGSTGVVRKLSEAVPCG